jgi:hypothetical protein
MTHTPAIWFLTKPMRAPHHRPVTARHEAATRRKSAGAATPRPRAAQEDCRARRQRDDQSQVSREAWSAATRARHFVCCSGRLAMRSRAPAQGPLPVIGGLGLAWGRPTQCCETGAPRGAPGSPRAAAGCHGILASRPDAPSGGYVAAGVTRLACSDPSAHGQGAPKRSAHGTLGPQRVRRASGITAPAADAGHGLRTLATARLAGYLCPGRLAGCPVRRGEVIARGSAGCGRAG